MKRLYWFLFGLISLLHIIMLAIEQSMIAGLSKVFLMPLLTLFYFHSKEKPSKLVMGGLLFCWIGDVLLLMQNTPPFFILGLSSFLLAHFLYILGYRTHQWIKPTKTRKVILSLLLPVCIAGMGLIVYLFPYLQEMKIPVLLYAILLTTMVLVSIFRDGKTTSQSFWLVFIGALLFMISDSLIAINKFINPLPWSGVQIMLTYLTAQALIVHGLIAHPKRNE
jgi:uncharacterized membrane protein YhhN